jgi:hypothetical protein
MSGTGSRDPRETRTYINGDEMNLGVSVFACFRRRHLDDFAGTTWGRSSTSASRYDLQTIEIWILFTFDHHMTVLAKCRTLHGVGERGACMGLKVVIECDQWGGCGEKDQEADLLKRLLVFIVRHRCEWRWKGKSKCRGDENEKNRSPNAIAVTSFKLRQTACDHTSNATQAEH